MSRMRPGQLAPNEFELAILRRIMRQRPSLGASLGHLRVLSREFTGVGIFTTFDFDASRSGEGDRQLGLEAAICIPNVPNGVGAVLFCNGEQPRCLEVFTYGDDHWDGVYDGFSIQDDT